MPEQTAVEMTVDQKLDVIGQQMNWLCENMQSLFLFVQQMSSNGGGIRGIMNALKSAPPEMKEPVHE